MRETFHSNGAVPLTSREGAVSFFAHAFHESGPWTQCCHEQSELAPIWTLLANSLGHLVEPLKSRNASRSERISLKPIGKTNEIDRCRDGQVLQMRLR